MQPDYFIQLTEERDRITLESLLRKEVEFTKLREISKHFEKINSNGTDKKLWESILKFFHALMKES